MLSVRVIPCLDVRGGRVVKGVRFAGLSDSGDPAELAERYAAQGADEIVLLDVAATGAERLAEGDAVSRVRERLSIPLTVGGGVRDPEDARRLLEQGADRVSVNTAAVEDPHLVSRLADRFGSQCTVIAIDAAAGPTAGSGNGTGPALPSGYEVVTRSGQHRTGLDATVWAAHAARAGAGEILLTSFDRDGTREGYDLSLVARVRSAVRVPIIASGGASNPGHMGAAVRAGADAVLAASIFHEGEWTVGRLKDRLSRLGVAVRR